MDVEWIFSLLEDEDKVDEGGGRDLVLEGITGVVELLSEPTITWGGDNVVLES